MAENDDGRMYFIPYIDNSELQRSAQESKRILASIGDAADNQGDRLDTALSFDTSSLRTVSKEASRIFADLGKDFDVSTVEGKIKALETVIGNDREAVRKLSADFDELGTRAKEAFAAGNFEEFDALTSQMEQTAAYIKEASAEADDYAAVLESMRVASGRAADEADRANAANEKSGTLLVKLLGGQQQYNEIVAQMPDGIQRAARAITGMTGAAKAFIATPLGAILAAIILALKTMKTWFDSSAEGQMAFARISGYVSGVLGQLKEIVIAVGKALYEAFSNPKEAVVRLWSAIKENIVNRFKALGDIASSFGKILKSAFTFDADGIKQGVKELGESFLQLGTGVDRLTDKVGDWASGVHEAAKATADIKVAQKELDVEVSKWQKTNEELERQKADARMKMYDTALSADERKQALDAYKAALDRQIEQEKEFADRRIALQKQSMSLTSNTIEDENRLRELEAARAGIDTRAAQELAMLQRRANGILNPGGDSQAKAEQDAERRRASELLSLQERNRQAEIDAMEEGLQKKIEQIRLNYDREIAEVTEQERKWREAQEGGLTEAQRTALKEAREGADRKRRAGTALVTQEDVEAAIQEIQTYNQRRQKIEEDYAKRRKALFVNGDESKGLKGGIEAGNLDELKRQEDEALAAVDEQFASREESYRAWCESIADMTLEQLETTLARAKEELDFLEASGVTDAGKLSEARAKVAKAQEAVNKASARTNASLGKRTLQEWNDLRETLESCIDAFDEVGDAVGGAAGDIVGAAGGIASSTLSMINGIVQLVTTSATGMTVAATGASKAISAVEKASVILAVVSAAMQVAAKIVNLVTGIVDKRNERSIEALQKNVDGLSKSYDDLQKKRDSLYSSAAAANLRAQNANLQRQQQLIRQQIAEEESKKKSDDGRIDEWRAKLEEIDEQIRQNREAAKDAIWGTDIQGAIEDFSEAIADAWADGMSASEGARDFAKKMIRQTVTEAVKGYISASGQMQRIRDEMAGAIADGVITEEERRSLERMAESLAEDIQSKYGWADDLFKEGDAATGREASTKGGIAASQDSVDESNARLTTIQGHTYDIREALTAGREAVTADLAGIRINTEALRTMDGNIQAMRDNMATMANTGERMLVALAGIEGNTGRLEAIETHMRYMRNAMDDMALKGIRLR